MRRRSRAAQDRLADASAFAAEAVGAIRTMQSFGAARADRRALRRGLGGGLSRPRAHATASRALLSGVAIFLVTASVVCVLWNGATEVFEGRMTGGRLSQFVLYAVLAASSLGQLSEVYGEICAAAGAAEPPRRDPGDEAGHRRAAASHADAAAVARRTRLRERLASAIPAASAPALSDLSFAVRPGERVALVGPSGAGKSTVLQLVLRFYDPQDGPRRRSTASPAPEADPEAWRARFALVPQEPTVFGVSVRDNIAYGRPGATPAEVEAAARLAAADGFIRALPQGYDTVVGERGVTLVGRPAPAPRHRARDPEGRADPAARRGDHRARFRERARGAGRARPADAGAHHAGGRASPGDHPLGRPHPRHG